MGKTNVVKHTINTGDALPIRQQPRRLPFHQREEVQRLDMLKGVIEPANSPWSSPIVIVVEIDPADREKTAFGTSFGLHQ